MVETQTVDVLAAVFFVVAGAWLLIALLYSFLVLVFLRMQARGELMSMYHEEFGRVYFCGRNFYIPLGCIFRRYIEHLQRERARSHARSTRYMTPPERRAAMETLLQQGADSKNNMDCKSKLQDVDLEAGTSNMNKNMTKNDNDNDNASQSSSSQEVVCSICLSEYDDQTETVLHSKTCSHQFHTDCVMDWLQRPSTTECPCCRVPMVSEDDVWKTVCAQRKAKRKALRRERRKQRQINRQRNNNNENKRPQNNSSTSSASGSDDSTSPQQQQQQQRTCLNETFETLPENMNNINLREKDDHESDSDDDDDDDSVSETEQCDDDEEDV